GLGHVTRGIEVWAASLARALHSRGCAVTLCKGAGQPDAPFEKVFPCWQRDEARTRRLVRLLPARLFWRLGLASTYGVEQMTFALGLIRFLRRGRIDILHVQDPPLARLAQFAARLGL